MNNRRIIAARQKNYKTALDFGFWFRLHLKPTSSAWERLSRKKWKKEISYGCPQLKWRFTGTSEAKRPLSSRGRGRGLQKIQSESEEREDGNGFTSVSTFELVWKAVYDRPTKVFYSITNFTTTQRQFSILRLEVPFFGSENRQTKVRRPIQTFFFFWGGIFFCVYWEKVLLEVFVTAFEWLKSASR